MRYFSRFPFFVTLGGKFTINGKLFDTVSEMMEERDRLDWKHRLGSHMTGSLDLSFTLPASFFNQ